MDPRVVESIAKASPAELAAGLMMSRGKFSRLPMRDGRVRVMFYIEPGSLNNAAEPARTPPATRRRANPYGLDDGPPRPVSTHART